MLNLRINSPSGNIDVITSKSELHRLLFIAVLRNKYLKINNPCYSDDILRTIDVLRTLGANINTLSDSIIVNTSTYNVTNILNCGESGTTLRFLIPFTLLLNQEVTITGINKLKTRPIDEYFTIFDKCNVKYSYNGSLPLTLKGLLTPGVYNISGSRSSQFISGLLIALSFLKGKSKLIIKDKLESKSYVNMTIKILNLFNVLIEEYDDYYIINPYNNDNLEEVSVNMDFSQASYFLIMNALGGNIRINNITNTSLQGDIKIIDYLKLSGVVFDDNYLVKSNEFKPLYCDLSDNPDLAPGLAVYAARLKGRSYLRGLSRLKYKESDRYKAIIDMLSNVGVNVKHIDDNTLMIDGSSDIKSSYINIYNDHRILFSAAILSMFNNIIVDDLKPKDKSYPEFFNEYIKLGGTIDEVR